MQGCARLRVVRERVVVPPLLERGVAVQPQRRLRGLELLERHLHARLRAGEGGAVARGEHGRGGGRLRSDLEAHLG